MKHTTPLSSRILATLFAALSVPVSSLWAGFPAGSDDFASAPVIPSATLRDASAITDISTYDVEAGESSMAGGKHTAWWKWTAPANGWVTFHTMDDSTIVGTRLLDSHLAVYKGAAVGSLGFVESNNNSDGGRMSRVSFYAASGITYNIQLDSANQTYGQAVLSMRFYQPQKLRILGSSYESKAIQLDLTASAYGTITGKLMIDGKVRLLKGAATIDGYFNCVMPRLPLADGTPVEPLVLTVDLMPASFGGHYVWLEGNDPDIEYFNGYHALTVTAAAPHTIAPYHTATLKPSASNLGNGYFSTRVATTGAVAMAGRTGDGKPFTSSSVLCERVAGSCHVPFGMGSPLLTGSLVVQDVPGGDDTLVGSGVHYVRRAAPTSTFYKYGFYTNMTVKGGAYVPPPTGQRALGFLNGTNGVGHLGLDTVVGEYTGFTETLTFTTANTFTFASPTRKPVLKLNRLTGAVTGSLVQPAGKLRYLYGMLANDGGTARIFGYVTGPAQTGRMSVLP